MITSGGPTGTISPTRFQKVHVNNSNCYKVTSVILTPPPHTPPPPFYKQIDIASKCAEKCRIKISTYS